MNPTEEEIPCSRITRLKDEKADLRDQVDRTEDEKTRLQEKATRLSGALRGRVKEVLELQAKVDRLEEERAGFRAEIERLESAVVKITARKLDLMSDLRQSKDERHWLNKELQTKTDQLEKGRAENEKERTWFRTEIERLESVVHKTFDANLGRVDEVRRLNKELTAVKKRNAELVSEAEVRTRRTARLRERLSALRRRLSKPAQSPQVVKMHNTICALQDENAVLRGKIAKLEPAHLVRTPPPDVVVYPLWDGGQLRLTLESTSTPTTTPHQEQ